MSDEIVVICPEAAPGSDGLADYTARVVEQWGGRWPVRLLVPQTAEVSPDREQVVTKVEMRRRALLGKLPTSGGKVLLQYSAYGFDRIGYPRQLIQALIDWKQQSGGLLVIMFHEIWTFWPVLNKNYLVQQLHRSGIGWLVRVADGVFTSTASQQSHLQTLAPDAVVQLMPVGSNIIPSSASEKRENGVAVLFGLQSSRIRALRQMHAELKALALSRRLRKIVAVGGGNNDAATGEERALLLELKLADEFEQRGALPETAVSHLLARVGFGVSSQDELSITKSGTFMAYAAHGLNILSPFADMSKPEPLCWLTSPRELLADVASDELQRRARRLRRWQEETASWRRIAERFALALQVADNEAAISS